MIILMLKVVIPTAGSPILFDSPNNLQKFVIKGGLIYAVWCKDPMFLGNLRDFCFELD